VGGATTELGKSWLEQRRLQAWELKGKGWSQSEIAEALGDRTLPQLRPGAEPGRVGLAAPQARRTPERLLLQPRRARRCRATSRSPASTQAQRAGGLRPARLAGL